MKVKTNDIVEHKGVMYRVLEAVPVERGGTLAVTKFGNSIGDITYVGTDEVTLVDPEACVVHINLTAAEIVAWHRAIEVAMATGTVDLIEFRNLLAEVRNAATAAGIDIEPTLLKGV